MADQLDALAAEFRAVNESARALVTRAGVGRLLDRPPKGGWNIAECFEHLNLTTRAYLPMWRDALASAPRGNGPYKTDFWGKALSWILEPPARLRIPTTKPFIPLQTPPPEEVLAVFLATQEDLLKALAKARGYALDQVRIKSPFNEKQQYSVWSSFRIQAPHQRRHLWQAGRILAP